LDMDFSLSALEALVNVILVDLVLAGDNAIVVGIAVAGLPVHQRWRVMVLGIAAATLLRIVFASVADAAGVGYRPCRHCRPVVDRC